MSGLLESLKSMYAHDATVLAGIENGSVRGIPLTKGKIAIIDEEDYGRVSSYRWCARNDYDGAFYAQRSMRINHKKNMMLMHRFIMGLELGDGKIIDHINHNGVDNRRVNLRVVSRSINCINCKPRKNNTTGFRGVYREKRCSSKWQVLIRIDGKYRHFGLFSDPVSAARHYDAVVSKYRGSIAILNFPRKKGDLRA
jgi:hypothetical protein